MGSAISEVDFEPKDDSPRRSRGRVLSELPVHLRSRGIESRVVVNNRELSVIERVVALGAQLCAPGFIGAEPEILQ